MGVLGLWQLLAPVGQPVTLESLENKIFAVDISIWLNQALKGYRDSQGGSVPNAHLLSLFSRLCKLLFYKIRPIIVFDGGFPELKKQTIINRQQRRAAVKQSNRDIGLKILSNYVVSQQLGQTDNTSNFKKGSYKVKEKARDEIFKLPPLPASSQNILSESYESNDDFESKFTNFSKEDVKYLNQIDIESEDFNALPPDVKQEILSTLKESRRHRSWEQYVELPTESNEFSNYQMQCLLKKRKLQGKLEEVQKDIRRINSTAYVSQYTNDHVIGETNKIMSDDASYYVLLKKIINQNENYFDGKSEDIKPSVSAMTDMKNAFIRDIENIDMEENFNFSDSDQDIKKEETNQVTENVKSEINLHDKNVSGNSKIIAFDSNIKQRAKSLDLSDEEYDVDNPPSLDSMKGATYQSLEVESNQKINILHEDTELNHEKCVNELYSVVKNSEVSSVPTEDVDIKESKKSHQSSLSKTDNQILIFSDEEDDDIGQCSVGIINESESGENSSDDKDELSIPIMKSCITKSESESTVNQIATDNILPSTSKADTEVVLSPEHLQADDVAMTIDENLCEANLELKKSLDAAAAILEAEQAKQDRQSRTVQDHMVDECKELLQLFGIPYVVSPLEAEAQCAFYDIVDFTHGTITDDSDVWLFGGKRVFKNFFTQQKFVESYKDKEIFCHFGLSRKKLINFAMLTGSDYTEGIENVGPVTAMEIISEFPGDGIEALQKFKDWWLDANKSTRSPENKVRAKLKKLSLVQNFPDEKVFEAYMCPEVDSSMEKFTWGRPDLDALRDYTKERFGWNQSKVDTALLPVLKKLNERDSQTHLDSFFTVTLRKETNLFPSKRIMSALKKITSPEKQASNIEGNKNVAKRKSKISGKKTVPKKAVRKLAPGKGKGRGKNTQPQGPVLSEESSSDSNS